MSRLATLTSFRFLVIMVLGGLSIVTTLAAASSTHQPTTITVGMTFAKSDLRSLARLADAIAIVEPTGKVVEHWNSADNRRWGDIGKDAFIYRDTEVQVRQVVFGIVPSQTIVIRGLGGTADNVRLDFEAGGGDLQPDLQYLVFLAHRDFPTKDGMEPSWSAVRLGQGIFSRGPGKWSEPIQGLTVNDVDISTLGDLAAP